MSNVFANNNAIACKAGDAKVIAAFPSVCLSPPSPPAGPVPVPYPNTSFSKDMQNGSKSVMIGGKEVMLKDQSFYKSSPLGNEAATNSFGASVVTHVITGRTFFKAWSMDVQFEGANVDRNIDLTTSNHASETGEAPLPNGDAAASSSESEKPKCDCCGGDAHSPAQEKGESITEEEFYTPKEYNKRGKDISPKLSEDNKALLDKVRSNEKCKDLLPPSPPGDDPCNKYYKTKSTERSRNIFEDEVKPTLPKDGRAKTAHRVALAGGGCPGAPGKHGNLSPVFPECLELEDKLADAQKRAADYHRKRMT